jgi:hypothetical protein
MYGNGAIDIRKAASDGRKIWTQMTIPSIVMSNVGPLSVIRSTVWSSAVKMAGGNEPASETSSSPGSIEGIVSIFERW